MLFQRSIRPVFKENIFCVTVPLSATNIAKHSKGLHSIHMKKVLVWEGGGGSRLSGPMRIEAPIPIRYVCSISPPPKKNRRGRGLTNERLGTDHVI